MMEPKGEEMTTYVLSGLQKAMWFLHELRPGDCAYNVALSVKIVGALDVEKLNQAILSVSQRHAAIRIKFSKINGTVIQSVANAGPALEIREVETSDCLAAAQQWHDRPFNLLGNWGYRFALFRGKADSIFVITAHHVVADFTSLGILLSEISKMMNGQEANGLEASSFLDYVSWQRRMESGIEGKQQLAYWRNHLAGIEVPLSFPWSLSGRQSNIRVAQRRMDIGGSTAQQLQEYAGRTGVTSYAVLLGIFSVLVARYAVKRDCVIGTATLGRTRPEFRRTVGLLIGLMPLRLQASDESCLDDMSKMASREVLGALDNQYVALPAIAKEACVTREIRESSLLQAMFLFQQDDGSGIARLYCGRNDGTPLRWGTADLHSSSLVQQQGQLDIILELVENAEGFSGWVKLSGAASVAGYAEDFASYFTSLVEVWLKDPSLTVDKALDRAMPDGIASRRMGAVLSRPAVGIVERFTDVLRANALSSAIRVGSITKTYRELDEESSGIASHLAATVSGKAKVIGLLFRPCAEMITAMLGVMKAGHAYLPLDPDWPKARVMHMLDDAGCQLVLTESESTVVDSVEYRSIDSCNPVSDLLLEPVAGSARAYVIFTSGSTGTPKGVQIEQAAVVRMVDGIAAKLDIGNETWTMFHSYTFDLSVWEIWGALLTGGTLVIVSGATKKDLTQFVHELIKNKVTILSQTPTALLALTHVAEYSRLKNEGRVRHLIVGGEGFPRELLERVRLGTEGRIWNFYGPTEATVWTTVKDVTTWAGEAGMVPLGDPIPGYDIWIVDQNMRVVPRGVTGELCIGGTGLARGYANRPQATADSFIAPQHFKTSTGRVYRTGDNAVLTCSNEIEFKGRSDLQVKVRGYRVEIGEIESQILDFPGVKEVAVVLKKYNEADVRIVAFVSGAAPLNLSDIGIYLRKYLPSYMEPSAILQLPILPRTTSDKIDRMALAAVEPFQAGHTEGGGLESRVKRIWCELLRVEDVDPEASFFAAGGHSLLLLQLAEKLSKEFGIEIGVIQVFDMPTIARQADYLTRVVAHAD